MFDKDSGKSIIPYNGNILSDDLDVYDTCTLRLYDGRNDNHIIKDMINESPLLFKDLVITTGHENSIGYSHLDINASQVVALHDMVDWSAPIIDLDKESVW